MRSMRELNKWFKKNVVKFEMERYRKNKEISNLCEHDLIQAILNKDNFLNFIDSKYKGNKESTLSLGLTNMETERIANFCNSVSLIRIDILNYSQKLMRYILNIREGIVDLCPKPQYVGDFDYIKIYKVRLPNDLEEICWRNVSIYLVEGEFEEEYHIFLDEECVVQLEEIEYKYLVRQVFVSPVLEEIYSVLPEVRNGTVDDINLEKLIESGFIKTINELKRMSNAYLN
ncbi:MAG: hypothetical protein KatS3mg083_264 [Candidatus Dojkabacteria bacterium]|nr:MAG: hypothetical protein KatS3mg083_264 [Candidatus Dojkabacteria bacterium]